MCATLPRSRAGARSTSCEIRVGREFHERQLRAQLPKMRVRGPDRDDQARSIRLQLSPRRTKGCHSRACASNPSQTSPRTVFDATAATEMAAISAAQHAGVRPSRTHLLDDEAVGDDFFFVKGARQCPCRQQTTGGNTGTVDRGHFKLSSNTIHALRRRDRGPQRAAGASVVGRAPAQAASSAAPGGAAAGVKDGGAVERDAAPGTRGS